MGVKSLKLKVKMISKPISLPLIYGKTQPNENVE